MVDTNYRKLTDDTNTPISVSNPLPITASGSMSAATDFEGGPIVIGVTAVELTFTGTTKNIIFQSDHDNIGTIWFGDATVTNTGANAMGRLEASDSVSIAIDDAAAPIYVVSDTALQNGYKFATK